VAFRLGDQQYVALNGPKFEFTDAFSICVQCDTQRLIGSGTGLPKVVSLSPALKRDRIWGDLAGLSPVGGMDEQRRRGRWLHRMQAIMGMTKLNLDAIFRTPTKAI
jgi:hypothetical protein